MSDVATVLDTIKGYGGYTTTASLWLIAFGVWWKGLPGIISVVDKLIENWANRRSAFEDRISRLLTEQEVRNKILLDDADRRHLECTEEQDRLRSAFHALSNEMNLREEHHHEIVSQMRAEIEGLKRGMSAVGLSAVRVMRSETATPETDAALERLLDRLQ